MPTIMLALDPVILAVMFAFEPIVKPAMLTTVYAVIMGLVMLALESVVIAVMLAFNPVMLTTVPVAPAIVVRHRWSG